MPREAKSTSRQLRILEQWKRETGTVVRSDGERPPSKLAFLLDHKYSPAGLAFDALEGDRPCEGQRAVRGSPPKRLRRLVVVL